MIVIGVVMGLDSASGQIASGGVKAGGFFASPLGRINLIITGIFMAFLIVMSIFQCIDQKSLFPLLDNTVFKVVGADAQLGQSIDELESSARPLHPTSIFSKQMPVWLWFWVKFWFEAIYDLWFIYFFCWLIYLFWYSLNNQSLDRNIIFTIITFLIISLFVGMIMYNMNLSGYCLPDDKLENFNLQMKHTYPLHGTIKFFSHWITKDLFYKVGSWTETSLGKMITSIPSSNVTNTALNISINTT
jgi:hypothetical protein